MSDSEVRDDSREVFMGVLFPAVMMTLVVANLWTGKAWVLARRGAPSIIYSISDPWLVGICGDGVGNCDRLFRSLLPGKSAAIRSIRGVDPVGRRGGREWGAAVAAFSGGTEWSCFSLKVGHGVGVMNMEH